MLPLQDKWIVVTRAKHQADNLCNKLEAAGAHVILFPLLEITPAKNELLVQQQLASLSDYDLAIFVSPNAVEQTFSRVDAARFESLKITAIGKKTATLLEDKGIRVDFSPKEIFNTEALLAMPEMQSFSKGNKIVILRGDGGRELLRTRLQKQGAAVDYINVYQRRCPQTNLKLLANHFKRKELDIILITSGNSLDNLFAFEAENDWLHQISLLAGSERIKQQVLKLTGYQGDLLTIQNPDDESIYQGLLQWGRE